MHMHITLGRIDGDKAISLRVGVLDELEGTVWTEREGEWAPAPKGILTPCPWLSSPSRVVLRQSNPVF